MAVSGRFASGPLSPSVKTVQRKRSWQSNITALISHRRLNLGEEQDVPLWLHEAGRNTDSSLFGRQQATCDVWLWPRRGPPHQGVSGYREMQNWVFHGGAKWDFGFGSLESSRISNRRQNSTTDLQNTTKCWLPFMLDLSGFPLCL